MSDWDFGEPTPVRRTLREIISDWFEKKRNSFAFFVTVLGLSLTLFFGLGVI